MYVSHHTGSNIISTSTQSQQQLDSFLSWENKLIRHPMINKETIKYMCRNWGKSTGYRYRWIGTKKSETFGYIVSNKAIKETLYTNSE